MLLKPIKELIDSLKYTEIPQNRRQMLQELIDYINQKMKKGLPIKLVFVCTHNSRRSHLTQIWAKVCAEYFGVSIETYSGGVEVTAMNDRVVNELKETGFIINSREIENPKYEVIYTTPAIPMVCYSKLVDDKANPTDAFCAIMTCSDADEKCPFIPGAEARIPIRYEDPKSYDDTPLEGYKYHERSMQILNEMVFVFSKIQQ